MRAFSRAAMLAALAILSAPVPGHALRADVRTCVTPEAVAAQVRLESPSAEIREVGGLDAANLTVGLSAATNSAIPPESTYIVVREPGSPLAYVVQFESGCAAHHGRFPDSWVRLWIKGAAA